ncbi:hypothetical protein CkaCkLH20_09189 [Colletotrichum karsti]|uniref:Uncharacterized protein n=1 Tax=Colletotrichum karsti TaxID=1095194 RepID=A0A9P6LHP2_9PEZI|nr:uncharacterized protein CkaCkLH20_09189 [Colletotrichum karsti]KAF9873376.1 hypothetical protein CkaCkLH20_09189 [Colletotrichum karsti]
MAVPPHLLKAIATSEHNAPEERDAAQRTLDSTERLMGKRLEMGLEREGGQQDQDQDRREQRGDEHGEKTRTQDGDQVKGEKDLSDKNDQSK